MDDRKYLFLTIVYNLLQKSLLHFAPNIQHLQSSPRYHQSNGQGERMIGTLKRVIKVHSSYLEHKVNPFLYAYMYNYMLITCIITCIVPQPKSLAEIFFGCTCWILLELFTSITFPKLDKTLTSRQSKIKKYFDFHHDTKPYYFIPRQTVIVQFSKNEFLE